MHADIDRADRVILAGDGADLLGEAPGERAAARVDADKCQERGSRVLLDDFVGHPGQGPPDGRGVEDPGVSSHGPGTQRPRQQAAGADSTA